MADSLALPRPSLFSPIWDSIHFSFSFSFVEGSVSPGYTLCHSQPRCPCVLIERPTKHLRNNRRVDESHLTHWMLGSSPDIQCLLVLGGVHAQRGGGRRLVRRLHGRELTAWALCPNRALCQFSNFIWIGSSWAYFLCVSFFTQCHTLFPDLSRGYQHLLLIIH